MGILIFFYSLNSLICIRAGLHRYFTSPPVNRIDLNIIGDFAFNQANRMLKTMVAKYKLANQQASSVHKYPAIIEEDMKKIRIYFDRSNPEILKKK